MAAMNKLDMLNRVRDLIRERLGSGQSEGNWSNATLFRYIDQGLWNGYFDEIYADKTRFLTQSTLTCDGTEFVTLPTNFQRMYLLRKTADIGNSSYAPFEEISPTDRQDWERATSNYRAFYFYSSTQIGVLPVQDSGTSLTLDYYKKFAELDNAGVAYSDLHELTQWLVCLYAAHLALVDRADPNAAAMATMIEEQKNRLSQIRRSSRMPRPMIEKRVPIGYTGGPVNIA